MDLQNNILEVLSYTRQSTSKQKSKRCHKVSVDVAACFTCLALSARPSFLYDYGVISVDIALATAQRLSSDIAALHDIIVLEFAQDIIFAKLDLLLQHLQHAKVMFVDVGGDKPKITSAGYHVEYLLGVCKEWKAKTSPNSMQSSILKIEDRLALSGPTIIGLLLGYPFVYFLQDCMNCLGSRPLLITKCLANLGSNAINVCSFSLPVECVTAETKALLANWQSQFKKALSVSHLENDITETIESFPVLAL